MDKAKLIFPSVLSVPLWVSATTSRPQGAYFWLLSVADAHLAHWPSLPMLDRLLHGSFPTQNYMELNQPGLSHHWHSHEACEICCLHRILAGSKASPAKKNNISYEVLLVFKSFVCGLLTEQSSWVKWNYKRMWSHPGAVTTELGSSVRATG